MHVVVDIEANSLTKPTKIWCVVCLDIHTNEWQIFRNLTDDLVEKEKCLEYLMSVRQYIGHNFLEYDYPVLHKLLGFTVPNIADVSTDTLIVSRLVDYSRQQGHSIEAYGQDFGLEKIKFNDWTHWSQEMEDYCVRDVEICSRIYSLYSSIINDPSWTAALNLEHNFQLVVNQLHDNGFAFDHSKADALLVKVNRELAALDLAILEQFPPRLKLVREVTPKVTQYGTLNRTDFRWIKDGDLSEYNGGPFCRCVWDSFNPASTKQIIEVLNQAGWRPIDKTVGHQKELRSRTPDKKKLDKFKVFGYKVNENNLSTLPPAAPAPARTLAKRIVIESRRRTLTEWLGILQDDGRIHGKFVGLGAWTHRMAHQNPNTANIPNEYFEDGKKKFLGKELRSLWIAPRKRLLVGVDAEGIQLRIFAHYVNDPDLTRSLVNGRKEDKTDPHSLNQSVLGSICKSRQAAKRFLYALLLGGGVGKFAEILGCSKGRASEAVDTFNKRYPGFDYLRRERFPGDAERGYFIGLDGRKVRIPGDTLGDRRHLAMSGYLQNGEAIIMKMATLKWINKLSGYNSILVNFVHDEWQTECPNNVAIALQVAKLQADSLQEVGEELELNCPMAGSYWNDDKRDFTIGTNWYQTH